MRVSGNVLVSLCLTLSPPYPHNPAFGLASPHTTRLPQKSPSSLRTTAPSKRCLFPEITVILQVWKLSYHWFFFSRQISHSEWIASHPDEPRSKIIRRPGTVSPSSHRLSLSCPGAAPWPWLSRNPGIAGLDMEQAWFPATTIKGILQESKSNECSGFQSYTYVYALLYPNKCARVLP